MLDGWAALGGGLRPDGTDGGADGGTAGGADDAAGADESGAGSPGMPGLLWALSCYSLFTAEIATIRRGNSPVLIVKKWRIRRSHGGGRPMGGVAVGGRLLPYCSTRRPVELYVR